VASSGRSYSYSFSFRERNRRTRQGLHVGQDVSALFRRTDAGKVHLGTRSIALRVFEECVEVVVGPDLTFGLLLKQDVRIGEAFSMRLGVAHGIIEVRAHLVGLAFAEAVARLALAGRCSAAFGTGAGQEEANGL